MHPGIFRANLLLQQDRFELAIEECRRMLADDPSHSGVQVLLAYALLRAGKWHEALQTADRARESGPENPEVFSIRCLIFLQRSMQKEAEEAIRVALTLEPDEPDHHGLLARVLFERSRFPEALAAADAGLALDGSHDLCLTYRARCLSSLGRHEESRGVSEELLRDDPLDSWNHCLRGEELLATGRPHEAREHFLESLRLSPGNRAARQGFAIALKARSPIFGLILSCCLRLERMRSTWLWGAIIVLFLAMQAGNRFVAGHPEWGVPWEILKALVIGGFIFTFIANPVFDLILRFDREGRLALSDDERRATTWYLVCFGLAALCALWAATSGKTLVSRPMGIAYLMLCAPIAQTFQASRGYVRRRLAWTTGILGGLLTLHPIVSPLLLLGFLVAGARSGAHVALQYVILLPLVVMVYSAFSATYREWLEKRRPDQRLLDSGKRTGVHRFSPMRDLEADRPPGRPMFEVQASG